MIPALILQFAPLAVKIAEQAFGPKTGQTKKKVATDIVSVVADQLATAGRIEGVPQMEAIGDIVEVVVQALNQEGVLDKRTMIVEGSFTTKDA